MHTFLSLLVVSALSTAAVAQDFDFIVRHGRIVDGSGNPSFHGDLAVKDGRIVEVGRVTGSARQEFDATGLIVAPGFIDVHTHAEDIEEQPLAENFLRMGVTTLVLGNCGSSVLRVGDFFQQLKTLTISPNVATLIGHGTVRSRAMHGVFQRPPSERELAEMQAIVATAMEEGALGLSTGLIYTPGVFAETPELVELAKVAVRYGGIYATHQRSEAGKIFESLDEVFQIAREAKIRAHVSHLKLSGPANWGQAARVLETIDAARAGGLDVTQDQYAYTASSTGLSQLIPDAMKDGGRAKFLERLNTPEIKAAMVEEMKAKLLERKSADYAYVTIASCRADPSFNGLTIVEAARQKSGSDSLDAQLEVIFAIERGGSATAVFHGMSEEDLETFMKHPNTMFASDSGVRRFQVDVPHPRGYGNNARILGVYLREKKILRVEDAIRKMTALPAHTFRLPERGTLQAGFWADVTVFDPGEVSEHTTFKDPHHYATGFRWVWVNGQMVIEKDTHLGARPGRTLRLGVREP